MKKTAIITRVEINKDNELVATDGKDTEGWAVHEKANLGEKAIIVKQLNKQAKEDGLTFGQFGDAFDNWNDELDDKYGFDEGENEDESPDDEEEKKVGMSINADYKAKYAKHNQSCGDELANAMHDVVTIQVPKVNKDGKKIGTKDSCSMAEMKKIAKANGLTARLDGWMHLNIGHIRMILRNALFAMIQNGERVEIGTAVWKEDKKLQEAKEEKRKKTAKKFADLKKKGKAKKDAKKAVKKDNKIKKNKKKA